MPVELLRTGPSVGGPTIVLAHGAGAGMRSEFMEAMALGLAARGIAVVRFEFPYMRAREMGGRRPPDRADVLMACWREVVQELGGVDGVWIGGKSMGGRIATMIGDETGVRGIVCLGYPFHPPEKPGVLRTAHLAGLRTPTLIVQGTEDEMGSRIEVESYQLSSAIRVEWIEGGDHSLGLGRGKKAREAAVSEAVQRTERFMRAG